MIGIEGENIGNLENVRYMETNMGVRKQVNMWVMQYVNYEIWKHQKERTYKQGNRWMCQRLHCPTTHVVANINTYTSNNTIFYRLFFTQKNIVWLYLVFLHINLM